MTSSSNTDTDKWIKWIETGIAENYVNYHEFNEFQSIQRVGSSGTFCDVYRADWKNTVVALKSFRNDSRITKEISSEVNNTKTFYVLNKKSIKC